MFPKGNATPRTHMYANGVEAIGPLHATHVLSPKERELYTVCEKYGWTWTRLSDSWVISADGRLSENGKYAACDRTYWVLVGVQVQGEGEARGQKLLDIAYWLDPVIGSEKYGPGPEEASSHMLGMGAYELSYVCQKMGLYWAEDEYHEGVVIVGGVFGFEYAGSDKEVLLQAIIDEVDRQGEETP